MKFWPYINIFLLLLLSLLIIAILQLPDGNLHIISCDVGQGDATLIIYKNIQLLTDGGPDNKVVNCLGRHLPFWDRKLEMVIATHPDSDHITGLSEVIKRYKVKNLLINPIDSGTPNDRMLISTVGSSRVNVVNPMDKQKYMLDLMSLDIVNPTDAEYNSEIIQNVNSKLDKYIKVKDTNLYSIVYILSFKKFRGLFTGDMTPATSDSLAAGQLDLHVDYIKTPHHGSKNGLTQNLLEKIRPKVATISVGKDNQWGFPSPSILEILKKYNVKVLRTDLLGDIEYITDGNKYWLKK